MKKNNYYDLTKIKLRLKICCLALIFFSLSCNVNAQNEAEIYASDLGDVYGIVFDDSGNLFATGINGETSVIWKIDNNGQKSKYAEIIDPMDSLAVIGISNHSQYLANMAIDISGNLWISSIINGACFCVTEQKNVYKIYTNTEYSISLVEEDTPYGVAWDNNEQKIYIITNGPESQYSSTLLNHITSLQYDKSIGDFNGLYAGDNADIRFIENQGIIIPYPGKGLIKENNTPLFLITSNALYEVEADGDFRLFGKEFESLTLWDAASDNTGNIYLSANINEYSLGNNNGEGLIIKMDKTGEHTILVDSIKEPLGLAFNDGYIYVADRATETIFKIRVSG